MSENDSPSRRAPPRRQHSQGWPYQTPDGYFDISNDNSSIIALVNNPPVRNTISISDALSLPQRLAGAVAVAESWQSAEGLPPSQETPGWPYVIPAGYMDDDGVSEDRASIIELVNNPPQRHTIAISDALSIPERLAAVVAEGETGSLAARMRSEIDEPAHLADRVNPTLPRARTWHAGDRPGGTRSSGSCSFSTPGITLVRSRIDMTPVGGEYFHAGLNSWRPFPMSVEGEDIGNKARDHRLRKRDKLKRLFSKPETGLDRPRKRDTLQRFFSVRSMRQYDHTKDDEEMKSKISLPVADSVRVNPRE